VTKPNGGQTWISRALNTVAWNNNLRNLESGKIELSADGGITYPTTLLSSTPSDGTQAVVVAANTTQGRIRITWLSNLAVTDNSTANFTID
jgi:hypothetical protein